jgi:hypothetical protein
MIHHIWLCDLPNIQLSRIGDKKISRPLSSRADRSLLSYKCLNSLKFKRKGYVPLVFHWWVSHNHIEPKLYENKGVAYLLPFMNRQIICLDTLLTGGALWGSMTMHAWQALARNVLWAWIKQNELQKTDVLIKWALWVPKLRINILTCGIRNEQ